jgi:hypothetical protein
MLILTLWNNFLGARLLFQRVGINITLKPLVWRHISTLFWFLLLEQLLGSALLELSLKYVIWYYFSFYYTFILFHYLLYYFHIYTVKNRLLGTKLQTGNFLSNCLHSRNLTGKSPGTNDGQGNDDSHVVGFNCSGLAQYAVYHGTNKFIARVSAKQYNYTKLHHVPKRRSNLVI